MNIRLDGKVALVTGGAGGFGSAYARALAAAGASVAVADLDNAAATGLANDLGARARGYGVDLREPADVERLVADVVRDFGGLDVLVNVGGRSGKYDFQDIPNDEWDAVIDANLKGTFLACKYAIPHLIARGGGRIINMGSSRGIDGQPRGAHYAASKGGVLALTRSLAKELRPQRITVNALAPGATDTAMWRAGVSPDEERRRREAGVVGEPDDLAPLVVLLASDAGYWLTGMTLIRDIFMPR